LFFNVRELVRCKCIDINGGIPGRTRTCSQWGW
jgi:hypothetical protein